MITGDGLKTLDAVRDEFAISEIEPTTADFERVVEGELATTSSA